MLHTGMWSLWSGSSTCLTWTGLFADLKKLELVSENINKLTAKPKWMWPTWQAETAKPLHPFSSQSTPGGLSTVKTVLALSLSRYLRWVTCSLWCLAFGALLKTNIVGITSCGIAVSACSETVALVYVVWGNFFGSSSHPLFVEGRKMRTLSQVMFPGVLLKIDLWKRTNITLPTLYILGNHCSWLSDPFVPLLLISWNSVVLFGYSSFLCLPSTEPGLCIQTSGPWGDISEFDKKSVLD